MTLFQKFSVSCIATAALTAVLAWAGTAFCPEGLGAAALTGAVLATLFTALCRGLGARLIFLRPLKAVGQRLRDLAEGRLDAAQAFGAEDLPATTRAWTPRCAR